jgi:hypothetical protein
MRQAMNKLIEIIPTQTFTKKELIEIAATKMLENYNKEQAIKGKSALSIRYANITVKESNGNFTINIEFDFTQIIELASKPQEQNTQNAQDNVDFQRDILRGAK